MIQTLTKHEEKALVETIVSAVHSSTGRHQYKNLRDLVMILAGLRCGFRVGEISRLRISHVWFQDHPVNIIHIATGFNKKNVEGWVKVSDDLSEALRLYVPLRLESVTPEDPDPLLLVSRPGEIPRNPVISRPTAHRVCELWRIRSGIRHFKFHCLRHTFATRLLSDGGASLRTVMMLLRHKSISSSVIYTHPSQDELDTAVSKAFNGAQGTPA